MMMPMTFSSGYSVTVLWDWWSVSTAGGYVGSVKDSSQTALARMTIIITSCMFTEPCSQLLPLALPADIWLFEPMRRLLAFDWRQHGS